MEAIIACLLGLSQLLIDFPELAEIDVNPIMVFETGQGCQVLDARIVLKAE
jgi:hypothetical protein